VPKGVRRLPRFDRNVLSLYARGMSVREIRAPRGALPGRGRARSHQHPHGRGVGGDHRLAAAAVPRRLEWACRKSIAFEFVFPFRYSVCATDYRVSRTLQGLILAVIPESNRLRA
jgi:hypothetical protein